MNLEPYSHSTCITIDCCGKKKNAKTFLNTEIMRFLFIHKQKIPLQYTLMSILSYLKSYTPRTMLNRIRESCGCSEYVCNELEKKKMTHINCSAGKLPGPAREEGSHFFKQHIL